MQESVVKGINKFIQSKLPEFRLVMDDYYDKDTGFTESLERRLAKVDYNIKEENWYAVMWYMGKPDPMSHQSRMFKIKDVQWVNNLGDLTPESEAQDPVTLQPKLGYAAVSPDYEATIVQSVLNLDFIFNSTDNASYFQELFIMRLYRSKSAYIVLPVIGKCCIYIDDIAMGEVDNFDRLAQGTLLSLPIDMVLTYPLIEPKLTKSYRPKYTTERKPLITNISFNYETSSNIEHKKEN